MIDTAEKRTQKYFIGSNTSRAFVYCGEDVFDGIKRIYVIKGGPGTGKSTFLKRAASACEEEGHEVIYYYCSSDPDSLDAITVKDLSIAITDGTSPHVYEAKFPGAKEEYLNFGQFWKSARLADRYGEIEDLTLKKAKAFTSAYKYLAIAEKVRDERESITASCYDFKKASAALSRLMKNIGVGEGHDIKTRQISAMSMKGRIRLDTYEKLSDRIIGVTDKRGVSPFIFDEIIKKSREARLASYISYDPLMRTEGIYFPEKRLSIVLSPTGEADKEINTERFMINDLMSQNRKRLRFLRTLEEDVMASASEALSDAEISHFALEKIYSEAMDFDALADMCGEFIKNKIRI